VFELKECFIDLFNAFLITLINITNRFLINISFRFSFFVHSVFELVAVIAIINISMTSRAFSYLIVYRAGISPRA